MVEQWENGMGLRIAEIDGQPVGASVLTGTAPCYVPEIGKPESYLHFLISDRARAGLGIGSELVLRAADDTRAAGAEVLRVDCWADAPGLVAWYVKQGFVPTITFTVAESWRGQVLEMPV